MSSLSPFAPSLFLSLPRSGVHVTDFFRNANEYIRMVYNEKPKEEEGGKEEEEQEGLRGCLFEVCCLLSVVVSVSVSRLPISPFLYLAL